MEAYTYFIYKSSLLLPTMSKTRQCAISIFLDIKGDMHQQIVSSVPLCYRRPKTQFSSSARPEIGSNSFAKYAQVFA